MSELAAMQNEVFSAHETLCPSEETRAALKAVHYVPEDPEAWMQLGLCLRRQCFFREAVEVYSEGLCLDPDKMLLYRHRGHAYVNLGLYQQAAADFERGLKLDETNWDCLYHLGLSYHLMGRYERAKQVYERCYALSKTDGAKICTTDWLCLTLMRMGDLGGMRAAAARITPEMNPGTNDGYFQRVLVYNGTRDAEEVLAEAEKQSDHMFATGAYGLAVYWECVKGENARAKQVLEEIARRNTTWGGFAEQAALVRLAQLNGTARPRWDEIDCND